MSSTHIIQWNFIGIMFFSTLAITVYSACPKPTDLPYAVPDNVSETYEDGYNLTYTCSPGYTKIPSLSNVATCVNDTWSTFPQAFCRKLNCDIPDILQNGNVEFVDTGLGSSVSYTCMEGYILFGNDTRTCLADEKWSGTVPTCNRTCPEPPNLQFTISNITTNQSNHFYPKLTKVVYTCMPGFTANTSLQSSTICQNDFTWSHIIDFCTKVSCGSPGKVENGKVEMDGYKFQSKAYFFCNDGYRLEGNAYRECMEDGAWSGEEPTCLRSCPDPHLPDYVEVIQMPDNEYFPVGIILTCKCLPGYKYNLFVSPTIQCLTGFIWSNATEFCRKVDCGDPERIKNGKVQVTGTEFGSIAIYSCNTGYTMSGKAQRKCIEDAIWDGMPPLCQCMFPCLLNILH